MKYLLSVFVLSFSIAVSAGQIVYHSSYSPHTLLQGEGKTVFKAEKDAMSSLPEGYVLDKDNSPAFGCVVEGEYLEDRLKGCRTGNVRFTIPIVSEDSLQ